MIFGEYSKNQFQTTMRSPWLLVCFGYLIIGDLYGQPAYSTEGCFIRYQYDAAGNRIQRDRVCISEANGGGAKSKPADAETMASGLQEVYMGLAPNPANDELRITLTADVGPGKIAVHDMQGRQVLQQSVQGSIFSLNVSSLQAGSYYVSFLREGERIVTGFTVQR